MWVAPKFLISFNALVVNAKEETVVETAFVDKGFVLHLAFLSKYAHGDEGQEDEEVSHD
mgnify:CR=1 FL=1